MNLINNLYYSLRSSFRNGLTHIGQRDLYEIFGYKYTPGFVDFYAKWERGDVAARVVESYPDACWCYPPQIQQDPDKDERNAWETQVDDLLDELDFFNVIHKLDILCQLGSYAVLFVGFTGSGGLNTQVKKGSRPVYLRPFSQEAAVIKETEKDPSSPRFGLPALYKITLEDGSTKEVHHSRVLHVSERTLDDPIHGHSILERIYNRLDDLEKVVGSSAEIWWLNGRAGLSLEADAETDLGGEEEKKALTDEVEKFQNGLSRVIRTKGLTVKPLIQAVPNPSANVDVILNLISAATGIPKRILSGSERGELASSQDENNWNQRVEERRVKHCTPSILNAFVDMLIGIGILGEEKYTWDWPILGEASESDKAEIASKLSNAISTYANSPEADWIVPPKQFVEEVLGLDYKEDDVEKIIEEERKEMKAMGIEDEETFDV